MPQQPPTSYTIPNSGGQSYGSSGVRGARAGERFRSQEEVDEDSDWQEYKKTNKLSFAATRAQHKDKYAAFRATRKLKREADAAARAGQIKAAKVPAK